MSKSVNWEKVDFGFIFPSDKPIVISKESVIDRFSFSRKSLRSTKERTCINRS
jgi:hypothetical protein